jgi:hypothetical protein
MKILSKRARWERTEFYRSFDYADEPGCGFGFPCDEAGNPTLTRTTSETFRECLTGLVSGRAVVDKGVRTSTNRGITPAVGLCDCGEEVVLASFTSTCACGADYNTSGQQLAPREQWGEETGETLSDILSIR